MLALVKGCVVKCFDGDLDKETTNWKLAFEGRGMF